jgi:ribosomal protein S18 acetylase RimI-like enzyme
MATLTEASTKIATSTHLRTLDPYRDLAAVADLIELCFADSMDRDGARYLQAMRAMAKTHRLFQFSSVGDEWLNVPVSGYVWEEDQRLVGNLSLIPFRQQGKRNLLIANVAVHPDYRRRGIGRALTEQGIAEARRRGAPAVWLQVRAENDPAVELYRSLGFIERTRRTTWYSNPDFSPQTIPQQVWVGSRSSRIWVTQRLWLEQLHPDEYRWHLPLKIDCLRPGIAGIFHGFMNAISVNQWVAWQGEHLLGILACQSRIGYSSTLWLASTPQDEDLAMQVLVSHARDALGSRRSFVIDYPAQRAEQAIRSNGFRIHQTLIWMAIEF